MSHDIVRLRYVSRKMRSISETSRNFMWSWYDRLEERTVNDMLRMCVSYIKQLALLSNFGCISPLTAMEMLWHCVGM